MFFKNLKSNITQRKIVLNGHLIEYECKISARSRRMRLMVQRGGNFVVMVPLGMSERIMEKFILQKSDWVLAKIAKMKIYSPVIFAPISKQTQKRWKVVARELVLRRLEHFCKIYPFPFHSVTIRHQKTRWGSCSRQGNLNFNAKIAKLTPQLADYIIVHELCHLREMNHSTRFWNLVSQTFPDYKTLRRQLKKSDVILQ